MNDEVNNLDQELSFRPSFRPEIEAEDSAENGQKETSYESGSIPYLGIRFPAEGPPIIHSKKKRYSREMLVKLEEKVSKAAIDKFYSLVKPVNGNRWYDQDPVISKTVELLRVVPPDVQRACAIHVINSLKDIGVEYTSPNLQKLEQES